MNARKREFRWQDWVNRLAFCYGCGNLAPSRPGGSPPRGWKVIYQPHQEADPGLHVCSEKCKNAVVAAIKKGPVYEPLKMADSLPLMPVEVKTQMLNEATKYRTLVEVFGKQEGNELYQAHMQRATDRKSE